MRYDDPLLLATAIEAVSRAGEIQMAHFGRAMRIDKKSAIDLVTEVDLEVEQVVRALILERFPDHEILGEEFGAGEFREPDPNGAERSPGTGGSISTDVAQRFRWLFDPVDG